MNDSNMYGYEGGTPTGSPQQQQPTPAPPAHGSPFPGQYRFSQDEMRVINECNRESFFQRSMPLGSALGLGTFVAVQNGYLRPNARFGAFPKVTLAVVVGYFLGKLSYQEACAEKLMALPGSYIGQLLRERRDGKMGAILPKTSNQTMFGAGPNDIYSDAGPGSSLDLDTDRPLFSDDTYRPDSNAGSAHPQPQEPASARPSLSYEDLRRKNRGEYSESRQDPYRMESSTMPAVTRARTAPPPPPSPPSPSTNKYGDVMD